MSTPSNDDTMSFNELAEGAKKCLMGLAVKCLKDQGRDFALAVLNDIAVGAAHIRIVVEIEVDQGLIVGQLDRRGELLPLMTVAMSGIGGPPPTAAH